MSNRAASDLIWASVEILRPLVRQLLQNVFAALDGTRPPTLLNPDAFKE